MNSSMSQSTLQSTIQSAPHCAFVLFAARLLYHHGADLCAMQRIVGWTASRLGPGRYLYGKDYFGVSAGSYPLNFPACTTAASVQYLSCNGGRPSPDGGGCIYIAAGVSNLTVTENYLYGNQGNAGGGNYHGR